eukprot:g28880.t1
MGMVSKKRGVELGSVAESPKKLKVAPEPVEPEASEPKLSAEKFRAKFQISAARAQQPKLPEPVQSFEEAPFGRRLKDALMESFSAPSPIQAQAWPICQLGHDLVAVAKTGSGKTLAFLLPAFKLISRWSKSNEEMPGHPLVLVLAPTRELATQIQNECERFASASPARPSEK